MNVKGNNGDTPLIYAVLKGKLNMVSHLVEERKAYLEVTDNDGVTPLGNAVIDGYQEMVIYLVENGANLNAKDNNGDTPLLLVAKN